MRGDDYDVLGPIAVDNSHVLEMRCAFYEPPR